MPTGKRSPGSCVLETATSKSTLSEAAGRVKFTLIPCFDVATCVDDSGRLENTGGVVSVMVTSCVPEIVVVPSVAVHVTVVSPTGNASGASFDMDGAGSHASGVSSPPRNTLVSGAAASCTMSSGTTTYSSGGEGVVTAASACVDLFPASATATTYSVSASSPAKICNVSGVLDISSTSPPGPASDTLYVGSPGSGSHDARISSCVTSSTSPLIRRSSTRTTISWTAVLPESSVAVNTTVVSPGRNFEFCLCDGSTSTSRSTASAATGTGNST